MIGHRKWPSTSSVLLAQFNSQNGNRTSVRSLSAQVVPDPSATALLVQRAAFDQCPEMLLQRVAAGPGQFDGLANGDATMLACELDDL